MAALLVVCAACDRHVRASDTACPFCGAEREPSDLVRAPAGRVAYRAAVLLAGAAAISACEKQPKQDPPINNESSSGTAVAVYGPAPMIVDAAATPVPTVVPSANPTPDASAPKK